MRLLGLALAIASAGCAQPLTQLVVIVDSDLLVPGELDTVRIEVLSPDGEPSITTASLATLTLPISLGLVHRGGPLGPLRIDAIGELAGAERVRRSVRTGFVANTSREVRLDLSHSCAGRLCDGERTCSAGACVTIDVDPSALPPWRGTVSRSDVGPVTDVPDPPIDACAPTGPEACNGRDEDCDGTIDEGVCVCDPPCGLLHAVSRCSLTLECLISSCDEGWANCDDMTDTGCERSTRTLTDCGACDRACAIPEAVPARARGVATCTTGTCAIVSCDNVDSADCDGDVSNGCETNLAIDATNCGECGRRCLAPTTRCMGRECR